MSRTRASARRERERQRRVVALQQLPGPSERLGLGGPGAALGECDLQQQELLVGQAVAGDARLARRPGRVQRGDRIDGATAAAGRRAERQGADPRWRRCAAGAARRARAERGSRASARRRRRPPRRSCAGPPPPPPAPRARAPRARAATRAHRGAHLQQLTGLERARQEALVEPDRRRRSRVVAHAGLDDAKVAPARRPHVHREQLDAHRRLRADHHVAQRQHALGVVAPGAQKDITPITTKGVLIKKYQDANSVGSATSTNIPLLRLADIYLIAAEAEARLNGGSNAAYGFINTVRTRAGLPNLTTGLSKDAFIDAVLQERSWELFAEGDRWYDLTRTNKFLTEIPKAVNNVFPTRTPLAKHRYFPIPQDELNANDLLEQNPDWK